MFGIYSFDMKKPLISFGSENDKFNENTVCYETNKYIVIAHGIILNDEEMKKLYKENELTNLILTLFEKNKINELCGSYTIVVFNKEVKELYLYNDLLSKQSIFYAYQGDSIVFSNSFFSVANELQKKGIKMTIDSLGIKMMNRYCFFFDDLTYVNEIKFLKPYHYISFTQDGFRLNKITTPNSIKKIELNDAAKVLDALFREAIELEFKKNEYHGYKQITTLSGGMDSKNTFLYGLMAGYHDQICFTYAEANSKDFQIAQHIADAEGCQFFYHSITNGNFLKKRDLMADKNEAQMGYGGVTGLSESLEMYDTSKWGIIHTGVGGGEIMGDLCVEDEDAARKQYFQTLSCTDEEIDRLQKIFQEYKSINEFKNVNDIRCCLNSQKFAAEKNCEYISPFLYENFFNYMLSLPYDIKKSRNLYRYWVNKYCANPYPSTFQFGKKTKIVYFLRRCYGCFIRNIGKKTKYDMNPFQYWEKHNLNLIIELSNIYDQDMSILSPKLSCDILKIIDEDWKKAKLQKKMFVLTTTYALTRLV